MSRTLSCLLSALAVGALAACSSTPVAGPTSGQQAAAMPAPRTTAAATTAATPSPTAQSTVATVSLPAHLDPNNALAGGRSVYFDFEGATLDSEYTPVIERHGRYLASHPQLAIRVEGNTDERGSPEYNLALGQQRAQSVVKALKIYGVRDSQLEAVSWGEEKPRATGHGEADWSQNRRADLQYPRR